MNVITFYYDDNSTYMDRFICRLLCSSDVYRGQKSQIPQKEETQSQMNKLTFA